MADERSGVGWAGDRKKNTLLYARHNVRIHIYTLSPSSYTHPFFFSFFGVHVTRPNCRESARKKGTRTHTHMPRPSLSFISIFCGGHFVLLLFDFLPGRTASYNNIGIPERIFENREKKNRPRRRYTIIIVYVQYNIYICYTRKPLCGGVINITIYTYVYKNHIS